MTYDNNLENVWPGVCSVSDPTRNCADAGQVNDTIRGFPRVDGAKPRDWASSFRNCETGIPRL